MDTVFLNSSRLRIPLDSISDGDTIVVNQMGSSNTVFRSSNEFVFVDPYAENTEAEISESTENTENTESEETENSEVNPKDDISTIE